MCVNDEFGPDPAVDACEMNLYQPLLNDLLAVRDNLRHRILFDYTRYEYVIPVEIVIEPERRVIAIVASTTHRVPKYRVENAVAIAAASCRDGLPHVIVDERAGRVLAVLPLAVADIGGGPFVEMAVGVTTLRLMAVIRRIDLNASGLAIDTVAAISELELAKTLITLRSYRPFKGAE